MATILIDGYNLIRRSQVLSEIDSRDLERGRLALVKKLSEYKKITGHKITVVFDATATDNYRVEGEKMAGINILYSAGGQTADEVIIDLVRKYRQQLIVVSSDNQIIHAAQATGCGVLGVSEFENKINQAVLFGTSMPTEENEDKKPIHKRWITKKKGNPKKLPKSKRKALAGLEKLY